MSVTEQMEEYLETLVRLEESGDRARTGEVARQLGVTPQTATDMLQRLEKAGLVEYAPYKGAKLTDAGRNVGRRQLEKHRVVQAFLQEVVGMDHKNAHEAACDMEHTFPAPLETWMAGYLARHHDLIVDTGRKVKHQLAEHHE